MLAVLMAGAMPDATPAFWRSSGPTSSYPDRARDRLQRYVAAPAYAQLGALGDRDPSKQVKRSRLPVWIMIVMALLLTFQPARPAARLGI